MMNPKSSSALLWFSGILLLFAVLILNPSAGFFLSVCAAISALIPTLYGSYRHKIIGACLLLVIIMLGVGLYAGSKLLESAYSGKVYVHGAIVSANPLRTTTNNYFEKYGVLPSEKLPTFIPNEHLSDYVLSVKQRKDNVIEIKMQMAAPQQFASKKIILWPDVSEGKVIWSCKTDILNYYIPSKWKKCQNLMSK